MLRTGRMDTHLDKLVPASRDDDGVLGVGGEADARDPLGVALVGDGVLAVTECVPQLNGAVARARDDLAVVGGERDREDIVGVADEAAGGSASGELPQAERLVPGRGKGVCAVRGDDLSAIRPIRPKAPRALFSHWRGTPGAPVETYTVGHNVRVAVQTALGVAVRRLIARQVPDDEGLVARAREKHVGAARKSVRRLWRSSPHGERVVL